MTSGASGLAPDAESRRDFYFFFFFAAFFVAKTLTSLHNPISLWAVCYTAWTSMSSIASKVFGPTFRKRLSRFNDVATDVSGVFPLI
jgi:hypothetical protein